MTHINRGTISIARSSARRGVVLIGVLVALLLVLTLSVGWIGSTLARHDKSLQAEQRLQADWLAESGLERAAARLAADAGYSGEVWNVAAADLGGRDAARVEIHVAAVADRAAARRITVVADYPADPHRRSRVNREIDLEP